MAETAMRRDLDRALTLLDRDEMTRWARDQVDKLEDGAAALGLSVLAEQLGDIRLSLGGPFDDLRANWPVRLVKSRNRWFKRWQANQLITAQVVKQLESLAQVARINQEALQRTVDRLRLAETPVEGVYIWSGEPESRPLGDKAVVMTAARWAQFQVEMNELKTRLGHVHRIATTPVEG